MATELTTRQASRRKHLEHSVRSHAAGMGNDLLALHSEKLYLSTHETWESYCLDTFGITPQHSNRIIQHGKTLLLLGSESEPIGSLLRESHTREVAGLPDDVKVEVLTQAVATAPKENGKPKPTAKHVRETRDKVVPVETPAEPAKAESNGKAEPEKPKRTKQGKEISSAKVADELIKKYVGPLARGIDDLAKVIGGQGANHKAALDGLNECEKHVKLMRGGKR